MGILDNFKVVPLKEKYDPSYLTITYRDLRFNAATAIALGNPGYIQLMINERDMQVAIMASEKEENALEFVLPEGKRAKQIQVKVGTFLAAVGKLVPFERDGELIAYKVKGTLYPEEHAIIYDLKEAVESVMKPRGRKRKVDSTPIKE